jgi:hypothetical protein
MLFGFLYNYLAQVSDLCILVTCVISMKYLLIWDRLFCKLSEGEGKSGEGLRQCKI